jgi:hypothetical protein
MLCLPSIPPVYLYMDTKNKPRRMKTRKNSLTEGLYLDRQGRWVSWKDAAWFHSQEAAERFAQTQGIDTFGLFPCKCCADR